MKVLQSWDGTLHVVAMGSKHLIGVESTPLGEIGLTSKPGYAISPCGCTQLCMCA